MKPASTSGASTEVVHFTVDSRLLEELGERLVGKPATALAELIKNAYDADATTVEVAIDRNDDGRIVVEDNGHGMTYTEFVTRWMRLGSQHKREERFSRVFGRSFTGSKGVGRIAAQLLSKRLRLITVADSAPSTRLTASLDWRKAIETGDLIDVEVEIERADLSEPQPSGTILVLEDLRDTWTEQEVRDLARQIWQLQPPFERFAPANEAERFEVRFRGPDNELVAAFEDQAEAILRLWEAKAVGENDAGRATIALQFRGESPMLYEYDGISELIDGRFELRFYELQGRQPYGIKVGEARDYLQRYGGVHIYDGGFRLPYYGEKGTDWLLISFDTARRTTLSELLPADLQVQRGMLSLPQWYQVLGAVEVSTSDEPDLEVTITRDRLLEGQAFEQLRDFVRTAIHWYANEKARRRIQEAEELPPAPKSEPYVDDLRDLVRRRRSELPEDVADQIESALDALEETSRVADKTAAQRAGALGALATAGIAAVGYQHELTKQLSAVDFIVQRLDTVASTDTPNVKELHDLKEKLESWVARARQLGRVFSLISDPENLETEKRYRVKRVVETAAEAVSAHDSVIISTDGIDPSLRFPSGTYAEWVSVIQNALFNALNAVVEASDPKVVFKSQTDDSLRRLLIENTGVAIDLDSAEGLFEPFQREIRLSPERRGLGFGGTGLGLTVIRMLTASRGATASFVPPTEGFSTCLAIEWTE